MAGDWQSGKRIGKRALTEGLDVLLIQRACIEHYPPTLNQANILAASGLRVGVIDLSSTSASRNSLRSDIKRWQVHRLWDSKSEKPPSLLTRLSNGVRFRACTRDAIRSTRPKVVIGFDITGCVHVEAGSRWYRSIFHYHELPLKERGAGLGSALAHLISTRASRRADLVVFPDQHRAWEFQRQVGLVVPPMVVMNCPAKVAMVPRSNLSDYLSPSPGPLICYLGSVGTNQGLVSAARSMSYWPANARWVIIGAYADSVRAAITAAADSVGAAKRIIFLGPKQHEEALALAAGATLGLALIQPTNLNWSYSAGAINKRFEYMALGLPQVTNNGPGVSDLVMKTGCGVCVDPEAPEAIGRAIYGLLSDPDRLGEYKQNARAIHLTRFNYEVEFAKLCTWITANIRSG